MDTSAIFRFSGLPNNAQLELVPATKLRSESEVILALNLENGDRIVGNFIPSQTLLSVLEQLCPDCLSNIKNPVVIYMRQEIYGQNLETRTLRSLGITGGRAMIRLMDKAPEELKEQANVATPLPHKPVEEKPYIRKIKDSFTEVSSNSITLETDKNDLKPDDSMDTETSNIVENKSNSFKKGGTIDLIKLAKEKRKNTDSTSNQEKRPNVSSDNSNKSDILKKGTYQSKEVCECKRDETMEVDCCGKCQENCVNVSEDDIEDEFVFVRPNIFYIFAIDFYNCFKLTLFSTLIVKKI